MGKKINKNNKKKNKNNKKKWGLESGIGPNQQSPIPIPF